jgi:fructosamine-3-kinase
MSPVRTHGGLWADNLLSRRGQITVIDPAACYVPPLAFA